MYGAYDGYFASVAVVVRCLICFVFFLVSVSLGLAFTSGAGVASYTIAQTLYPIWAAPSSLGNRTVMDVNSWTTLGMGVMPKQMQSLQTRELGIPFLSYT
jgi:hypothetical protein